MLSEIMNVYHLNTDQVIFVGNKTMEGSEANIAELGIRTIQVDDVYECNILLKTNPAVIRHSDHETLSYINHICTETEESESEK